MAPKALTLLPERVSLPRGLSALPTDEVAESQRGRIMQAIVEQVADHGYHATSVNDVIRRAQVSRGAFYAVFKDKEDAFAVAHAAASQQLLDFVAAGVRPVADEHWRVRHRAGVIAYLGGFMSAPAYAVSFMVEVRAAGARLLDQRDRVLERHARRIGAIAQEAHRESPLRPLLSTMEIIGLAGGADELATREIRAGRIEHLMDLVDPIVTLHCSAMGAP